MESKSVQKRIAAQKGLPAPDFSNNKQPETLREQVANEYYIQVFKPGSDLMSGLAGEVTWQKASITDKELSFVFADQILTLFLREVERIKKTAPFPKMPKEYQRQRGIQEGINWFSSAIKKQIKGE